MRNAILGNHLKYPLPVSNVWTPKVVNVRVVPSLFVAVHMYVPMSSGLKSSMDNVPLLTLLRPLGKAVKARLH